MRHIAATLLPRIKDVARDTKLAAVRKVLGDLAGSAGGPSRACVFARYPSTVDYLATALRDGGHAVAGITELMSFEERSRALRECRDAHGIVVVGPSVTLDEEPGFSWFMLYDLPVGPLEFSLPANQFVWSFYGKSPIVTALADTSNALPHETIERELVKAGHHISSSDIVKAICPDSPDVE